MSSRGITLAALLAGALLAGGCGPRNESFNLLPSEVEFLSEDVIDLTTIAFQLGENAYLGDPVHPEDVIEEAWPGNDYTVTYDLPLDLRLGLGVGYGRVMLRVLEDGFPVEQPLFFSFSGTTADEVVLVYEVQYLGETRPGRDTDLDFTVSLTATRTRAGDFRVEYFIEGDCFLGSTFCEFSTLFYAYGLPRDGLERGLGNGTGMIDDPDVFAPLYFDIEFDGGDWFRAEGDLGLDGYFAELFLYDEVM